MLKNKKTSILLLLVFAIPTSGFADTVVTEDDLLADIHLVSSVTHMNQALSQTPAAVTIIDRRTIDASAAVDVLDLFRLVPGFRTYFVNANAPGVTYHSVGESYPRRLEVKIDGRSIYESIFSSVEWNTLGVELDDIDYIEVVRGGNAPADGSNAFLASINIVTRSPLLDSGWNLRAQIGSDNIRNRSLTYSGKLGEIDHRITLRHRSNDGFRDFSGQFKGEQREIALDDGTETITLGFKGLWTPSASDSIELQFGFNDSEVGLGEWEYDLQETDYQYQHVSWSHSGDGSNKYELIAYHNKYDINLSQDPLTFYQALSLFPEGPIRTALSQLPDKLIIEPESSLISERWDAEFRANFDATDSIRGVYGIAARKDRVSSNTLFDMSESASEESYRGYLNLEWRAMDNVSFNAGFISEHRNTGDNVNSYRIASNYQFSENHSMRLAYNRGYRAPTMLESQQSSVIRYDENLILDASIQSSADIEAEKLSSLELGYSGFFLDKTMNIDVRLYRERMPNLISERRESYPDFDGLINIRDNTDNAEVTGIEWQVQYRPDNHWLVHANYSYMDLQQISLYRTTPEIELRDFSKLNPHHLGGLLVSYETKNNLSFSTMVNHQSRIHHFGGVADEGYTRVDFKLAKKWRANQRDAEVSFTVQNVGPDYREFYFFNQFATRYILGLKIGIP
jgi:iron complex outermembrane receptor protein